MPTEHFKSKEAYRKNLAYRHMHNIPFTAKDVVVGGKEHAVKHSTNPQRERIDAKQRKKVRNEKKRKSDVQAYAMGSDRRRRGGNGQFA